MEYVENDLRKLMNRKKFLSELEVAKITFKIL